MKENVTRVTSREEHSFLVAHNWGVTPAGHVQSCECFTSRVEGHEIRFPQNWMVNAGQISGSAGDAKKCRASGSKSEKSLRLCIGSEAFTVNC